jgi:hypothetical protein
MHSIEGLSLRVTGKHFVDVLIEYILDSVKLRFYYLCDSTLFRIFTYVRIDVIMATLL